MARHRPRLSRVALGGKRDKVHVALGRFAHDSGIYSALDNHFAKVGQQR